MIRFGFHGFGSREECCNLRVCLLPHARVLGLGALASRRWCALPTQRVLIRHIRPRTCSRRLGGLAASVCHHYSDHFAPTPRELAPFSVEFRDDGHELVEIALLAKHGEPLVQPLPRLEKLDFLLFAFRGSPLQEAEQTQTGCKPSKVVQHRINSTSTQTQRHRNVSRKDGSSPRLTSRALCGGTGRSGGRDLPLQWDRAQHRGLRHLRSGLPRTWQHQHADHASSQSPPGALAPC